MAEITNELMYEVLKQIQSEMGEVKHSLRETNIQLNAITSHVVGLQQDISNIYAILTRHDSRLERIERRLEISEVIE
jgi:septal ring factor EnvC (AmiA/AmiB activator)